MIEDKISVLLKKGVKVPIPASVFIGEDVDLSRISGDGVTLYPGTRIMGKDTLIMAGSQIGFEATVTLNNVHVGPDTHLKGGFFEHCVFVGKNSFGSGAHVRGGTLLEEEASAAHTVGLKQTILFPFVTLGSLINFCDCCMAGGTSRKDHSEVGSSYIHFNYTPNQDKATPSMMGNVHQGVMLDQRPIFLGGQGGLVGPCRLSFGTVTAAGTIWRKDVTEEGRLLIGGGMREISIPRKEGVYTGAKRIFSNNVQYIAALMALGEWYRSVRVLFFSTDMEKALLDGMLRTLRIAIDERVKRLDDFVMRLDRSLTNTPQRFKASQSDESVKEASLNRDREDGAGKKRDNGSKGELERAIIDGWPDDRAWLKRLIDCNDLTGALMDEMGDLDWLSGSRLEFVGAVEKNLALQGKQYVRVIQSLAAFDVNKGTNWLKAIQNGLLSKVTLF